MEGVSKDQLNFLKQRHSSQKIFHNFGTTVYEITRNVLALTFIQLRWTTLALNGRSFRLASAREVISGKIKHVQ